MVLSYALVDACAILGIVAVVEFLRGLDRRRANPQGLPLPPGPPRRFLIGNLLDVPMTEEWMTYTEWGKKYGPLVSINVCGRLIIFVNSQKVATDLFERRSSIYSGRPQMPMLTHLMGWIWNSGFQTYSELWRRHRKLFHQQFHPEASRSYFPIQRRSTIGLLPNIAADPKNFMDHFKQMAGETILLTLYGIQPEPKNDYYIKLAEDANVGLLQAATPGAFLVDFLPILRHVPEWFPGAGFQRKARVWKEQGYEMRDGPFSRVKQAMASGNQSFSFCSELINWLEGHPDREEWEGHVKTAAGGAYAAGAETTAASLTTFILAMTQNPDVVRRAQAEIDNVIGNERLPEFEDRPSLPYVEAIVKELHRWQPVGPSAIPHEVTEDDFYEGYYIPKGTTIIGNAWSILHDEKIFPEPIKFIPERFLNTQMGRRKSTATVSFGFGRRVCPGRYLADNSVWHAVACLLATFDIQYARDAHGEVIEPVVKWTSGLICHPEPFECSITPRSEAAVALISEYHKERQLK